LVQVLIVYNKHNSFANYKMYQLVSTQIKRLSRQLSILINPLFSLNKITKPATLLPRVYINGKMINYKYRVKFSYRYIIFALPVETINFIYLFTEKNVMKNNPDHCHKISEKAFFVLLHLNYVRLRYLLQIHNQPFPLMSLMS